MPEPDDKTGAITAAKAALEGARAVQARCPSGENQAKVDAAERILNARLDHWMTTAR